MKYFVIQSIVILISLFRLIISENGIQKLISIFNINSYHMFPICFFVSLQARASSLFVRKASCSKLSFEVLDGVGLSETT